MSERKPVILIADDQEAMRLTVARILGLEGYNCCMAASGRTAIDLLEARPIHLALLDINMPGITGINVAEHMKADPLLSKIPIIMLTGQMDSESVLKCKALGVDDYLVKPYKIQVLLERITAALARHGL